MPEAPHSITLLGWYHLALFGFVIPGRALWGQRRLATETLPSRERQYAVGSANTFLFGLFSIATALSNGIALFPARLPWPNGIVAGVAMLGLAVAIGRPLWRRAINQRDRVVSLITPRTARERRMWLAVAALAGVSEEITWRGVQPALIATLVHAPIIAAGIAAVMFGVAHIVQGWRSALFGIMMALGFQSVVWLSGSLYVAMVIHFAYDAIAGMACGRLAEEAHSRASNEAPSPV